MTKRTITVTLEGPGADEWADYLIDELIYRLDNERMPSDEGTDGTIYNVAVDRHGDELDTASSVSRQHYIDTGRYLTVAETAECGQ